MYTYAMMDNRLLIMTMRKTTLSISQKKLQKYQRSLHRWVKKHGKKGRFCSGIHRYYQKWDSTGRAFIHSTEMTAIKVALKEIHKREDKRWVIYRNSQSSMQSIEFNKAQYTKPDT